MTHAKPSRFIAEILTIGSELTTGRVVNSNAAMIAKELTDLGFCVRFQTSVPDDKRLIHNGLRTACNRAGLVFVCGGLGPTDDDITTEVITSFVGSKPIRSKEALATLIHLMKTRKRVLTVDALKMAMIPYRAKILNNYNGMACGYYISYNNTLIVAAPGVPVELQLMVEGEVRPLLQSRYKKRPIRVVRTLKIFGIGEAQVNQAVHRCGLRERFPEVVIGYQVPLPEVHIDLEIADRKPREFLSRILEEVEVMIRQVLGDKIFAVDEETMSQVVHKKLLSRKTTLAMAESCTGGLLSSSLTEHPKSSEYFLGSVICYSNESKMRDLQVSGEILAQYGAVSAQCAEAMAIGVRERFQSQIGLSITGIAGPSGGTAEKPVGTVFMALAREGIVKSYVYNFQGNRTRIRAISLYTALNLLRHV